MKNYGAKHLLDGLWEVRVPCDGNMDWTAVADSLREVHARYRPDDRPATEGFRQHLAKCFLFYGGGKLNGVGRFWVSWEREVVDNRVDFVARTQLE